MSKRNLASRSPVDEPQAKKLNLNSEADASSEKHFHTISYPGSDQPANPVPFQQPTGLLTFSYTPQHVLEFTDSALRYYVDPPRGADLRYGYERWIKRPEEITRLDSLLRAVERVMQKTDASMGEGSGLKWIQDIAVVTWRGIITKILTAPYEERDRHQLNVMYVNGTLYIEEHYPEARLKEKEDLAPRQRQQMYYGYSFESWCTSSKPGIPERSSGHPPGWGGDVNTNVQWCSVVKTKLGDNRLVLGGEVDCVRDRFSGKTDAFVELKTSMAIGNARDEARFEKKMLKFYLQSFLLGVPEIVVGFRTPQGRLTTTQSFKTVQLPRLVRGKPDAWDPQVCFSWGQHFLSTLKSILSAPPSTEGSPTGGDIPQEPSRQVWRIIIAPEKGVKVFALDEVETRGVEAGEDRVGILPRWYFDLLSSARGRYNRPSEPPAVPPEVASAPQTTHQGWNI